MSSKILGIVAGAAVCALVPPAAPFIAGAALAGAVAIEKQKRQDDEDWKEEARVKSNDLWEQTRGKK